MDTVEQRFNKYAIKIWEGQGVGKIQQEETQSAYFAGFLDAFVAAEEVAEIDDEAKGAEHFETLRQECVRFFEKRIADMEAGR